MQPLPHHYATVATMRGEYVELTSEGLAPILSAAPAAYDGPGDRWSPETLLMGAIADCFILTFKAVAAASRFDYDAIRCEVTGTLDKSKEGVRFTEATLDVSLEITDKSLADKGQKLLEKAKSSCLISNSLNTSLTLTANVY